MVVQMLFTERYIFDSDSTFGAVKLNKFVYPDPTHLVPILKLSAGLLKDNLPIVLWQR
jgi:hypothetical protein